MKKKLYIVVGLVGLISLVSCGSTAPCGLAKSKQIEKQNFTKNQVSINKVIV